MCGIAGEWHWRGMQCVITPTIEPWESGADAQWYKTPINSQNQYRGGPPRK
jgi:hypothetical protein